MSLSHGVAGVRRTGFHEELDFKELDFKELEIHRYSLLDIHQWIFIDINEFIDGYPSMNTVPSFGPLPLGPFFGPFSLAAEDWDRRLILPFRELQFDIQGQRHQTSIQNHTMGANGGQQTEKTWQKLKNRKFKKPYIKVGRD